MGLKKYEIITVGSDKRVRALRSWAVGDRYVNIGDVGGIVYDEKTLSQDGACWLFRGNFGFPGARIGGDSIVDIGEATLSPAGTPAVDILGSSVVAGAKLVFESEPTVADAVVLTADDFEQGTFASYIKGQKLRTVDSANYIRTKNPIFLGGKSLIVKCGVPGFIVTGIVTDMDGCISDDERTVQTVAGGVLALPAGQYFNIVITKNPAAATVPADATAAAITFTGTYETKLSIVDSRVEINPATSTGVTVIRPGGLYSITPGAKYPDTVIRNSKVAINGHATANRTVRLISEFAGCNVAIDTTTGSSQGVGIHSSVKNLTFTGVVTTNWNVAARSIIQANDCDNFAVSPTVFPRLAEALSANMPFIFQGCNVPGGKFYHHAQIANTYKNIDFALASVDLGKTLGGNREVASSEVNGMYRLVTPASGLIGSLVESFASVEKLVFLNFATTYGTTIYKDAYINGLFDIAGTNVLGNKVRSHPLAQVLNVQPRAVQGVVNTSVVGQTITGVISSSARVIVPTPLRVNGATGLKVDNIPAGVEAAFVYVNPNNTVTVNSLWTASSLTVASAQLNEYAAYLIFRKADNVSPITPEVLAGVTVTTYNGCKIVNTGETAVNMKGNIRVEDNAILVNASVTGSGYFGGNSVVHYNPAVWASLDFNGTVYMKDDAVFAPIEVTVGANVALLDMRDNAVFAGSLKNSAASYNVTMADEARGLGTFNNSRSAIIMRGNSFVAAGSTVAPECRGLLVIEDDARIENGDLRAVGHVTLSGKYKQTASKVWTGKRVIDNHNAPAYDNNVKTKYDF